MNPNRTSRISRKAILYPANFRTRADRSLHQPPPDRRRPRCPSTTRHRRGSSTRTSPASPGCTTTTSAARTTSPPTGKPPTRSSPRMPYVRDFTRENRAFLSRAVRMLAAAGVRQFLDIGSGLPTRRTPTRSPRRSPPTPGSSTSTTTPSCWPTGGRCWPRTAPPPSSRPTCTTPRPSSTTPRCGSSSTSPSRWRSCCWPSCTSCPTTTRPPGSCGSCGADGAGQLSGPVARPHGRGRRRSPGGRLQDVPADHQREHHRPQLQPGRGLLRGHGAARTRNRPSGRLATGDQGLADADPRKAGFFGAVGVLR